MIDTICFSVPVSKAQFLEIRALSREVLRFNHESRQIETRFYTSQVNLGSFSRSINIFYSIAFPDKIKIEFSVPKFYYGHNIFLIYPSQLSDVFGFFYLELKKYFPNFPNPKTWSITRLDLCYSWKYRTQQQAEEMMTILRGFNYPRKRIYRYDSSVMYIGSSYSVKWYLKNPEFFAHDFKEIRKTDNERAFNLLTYSEGVLRFEVTLRKNSFLTHFGKKALFLTDLYSCDLLDKLRFFFNKSLEFDTDEVSDINKAFFKLRNRFSESVAVRLYSFYIAISSSNPEVKNNIYSALSKSQIRRNLNDLKKAGVGFLTTSTNPNFNLTLPSPYATSPDPFEDF